MVAYSIKRKDGTIARCSIKLSEIREVLENRDHTATLRVSEIRKNGTFSVAETLEGYDQIMLRIENEERKHAEKIFGL